MQSTTSPQNTVHDWSCLTGVEWLCYTARAHDDKVPGRASSGVNKCKTERKELGQKAQFCLAASPNGRTKNTKSQYQRPSPFGRGNRCREMTKRAEHASPDLHLAFPVKHIRGHAENSEANAQAFAYHCGHFVVFLVTQAPDAQKYACQRTQGIQYHA